MMQREAVWISNIDSTPAGKRGKHQKRTNWNYNQLIISPLNWDADFLDSRSTQPGISCQLELGKFSGHETIIIIIIETNSFQRGFSIHTVSTCSFFWSSVRALWSKQETWWQGGAGRYPRNALGFNPDSSVSRSLPPSCQRLPSPPVLTASPLSLIAPGYHQIMPPWLTFQLSLYSYLFDLQLCFRQ